MRASSPLVIGLGLFLFLGSWVGVGSADEKKPAAGAKKKPAVEAEPALRFPIDLGRTPCIGKIDAIDDDGIVRITIPDSPPAGLPQGARLELTEGYYVGIVHDGVAETLASARLTRVLVTDVGEAGKVVVQLAKSATEKLAVGEALMIFRPTGATTKQLKQLPDLAVIEDGTAAKKLPAESQFPASKNNLKQIALALHNFHDVYGRFPPAVINGPDGKPWHSWRVFLLPYLDQAPLYNEYKFDEPWNGTNNKRLVERMPAVFSDPAHGENKGFHTHYVAITGEDLAFSDKPAEFNGANRPDLSKAGRRIADFRDGTSNTLLVGPAHADAKIPWLKPEDILVTDKLPALGSKGSFGAPHKSSDAELAPFLRCDGSVTALRAGTKIDALWPFLTIAGNEVVDWATLRTLDPPRAVPLGPVIYVERGENGPKVRLTLEPIPVPAVQFQDRMVPKPRG